MSATIRPLTGDGSPPVQGSYPQAVEVTGATRWLYLSGQIPVAPDGSLAADFTGQCRQVWANVETQLHAAGMTLDNLVKGAAGQAVQNMNLMFGLDESCGLELVPVLP